MDSPQSETPLSTLLLVDDAFAERWAELLPRLCVGLIDHAVRSYVICGRHARLGNMLGPARIESVPQKWFERRGARLGEVLGRMPELRESVIHLMGGGLLWAARRLHEAHGAPIVAQVTALDDLAPLRSLPGDALHVLAASEALCGAAAAQVGLAEDRVHLVRPGVRAAERTPPLETEPGPLTVFVWAAAKSIGSLSAVLRAAQVLPARGADPLLFVLGAGPMENALRREVARLELRARVTFVSEHHAALIGASGEHVFVLPEPPRECGLPTLTAMAEGVVVVAAGAGVHDAIREGETALLFKGGDAASLAAMLDRLAQDRPLARRLSDEGRRRIREHHQVSTMIERTVWVYRQAAGAAQPAARG